MDEVIQKYQIPTQSCVLTHVTNTLEAIEQGPPDPEAGTAGQQAQPDRGRDIAAGGGQPAVFQKPQRIERKGRKRGLR